MGSAERVAATSQAAESFVSERLERVFNGCFSRCYNTRLTGGAAEPLYQPAIVKGDLHALYYRQDYFASALHEVAHWCIAGVQRRQQVDFGYWYTPESRCAQQQRAFESVEHKPQSLEWYFSKACDYRFQVSADNVELARAGLHDIAAFQQAVLEQAVIWQKEGLPVRAAVFYRALCSEFATSMPVAQLRFTLAELL